MNYLTKKKHQLGRFYLLPKIHKRTFNVPGRPGISWFLFKTGSSNIPHVLEDTRDFLSRLSYLQDITENAILVSFDMVGLYPNIPHEEGTDIMRIFKWKKW